MNRQNFSSRFAGLVFRFKFPEAVSIPAALLPFLCEDTLLPQAEYEIQLLDRPLCPEDPASAVLPDARIYYSYSGSWLRIYPSWIAEDGCQVALFLRSEGNYILYYPASSWDLFKKNLHFLPLIAIETALLPYDAFLLHSSLVHLSGEAVLFSGPSGIGKSTQAALWEKHLHAKIINGDRCVIRKMSGKFYGCGSPWAGTSKIYHPETAPIRGIFLLKQAPENSIRRVTAAAFSRIYSQSLVNSWDSAFIGQITHLISELFEQIPIYELSCRADEEAVRLAYDTLYKGGP